MGLWPMVADRPATPVLPQQQMKHRHLVQAAAGQTSDVLLVPVYNCVSFFCSGKRFWRKNVPSRSHSPRHLQSGRSVSFWRRNRKWRWASWRPLGGGWGLGKFGGITALVWLGGQDTRQWFISKCNVRYPILILTQEPDKTRTDPEDWNTDWSGIPSSKKKASDRGVRAFLSCYTSLYPEQHWLSKPTDYCRCSHSWPGQPPQPWKSRAPTGAARAGTPMTAGPMRKRGRDRALQGRTDGATTGGRTTQTWRWQTRRSLCPMACG